MAIKIGPEAVGIRLHGNISVEKHGELVDEDVGGKIHTIVVFEIPFWIPYLKDGERYSLGHAEIEFERIPVFTQRMNESLRRILGDFDVTKLEAKTDRWGWFAHTIVTVDLPSKVQTREEKLLEGLHKPGLSEEERRARWEELVKYRESTKSNELKALEERLWGWPREPLPKEEWERIWLKYRDMLIDEALKKRFSQLEEAINILNQFIDAYCLNTGINHIDNISYNDVFNFKYSHVQGKNRWDYYIDISMQDTLIVKGREYLPNEKNEELKAFLESGEPLTFYDDFMINAYRFMYQGKYGLAVFTAETAFEVFLEDFLREKYKQSGKGDVWIDRWLERKENLSVKKRARDLVKDVTDFDFEGTKEYCSWDRDARELRNDVAHGKKKLKEITEIQAKNAIKAIQEAKVLLGSI